MQYLIDIPQTNIERVILDFFQNQGIQYIKLEAFFKTQQSAITNNVNTKIIPAEEDGDITMLFGKWNDLDVEPENYRKQIWRNIEF